MGFYFIIHLNVLHFPFRVFLRFGYQNITSDWKIGSYSRVSVKAGTPPGTPGTPPGTPGTLPGTPGTPPGTPGNPPGTPPGTHWNTSYEATHVFLYKFTCFALNSG